MRPTPLRRGNVTRNALLGALAVALFGLAAWRFFASAGGEEAAPGDAASAANFICSACGEFYSLTARQLDDAERAGRTAAAGRGIAFACPKCGERRGVRAEKCPQHGEVIKLLPEGNDRVKCSKCDFRG